MSSVQELITYIEKKNYKKYARTAAQTYVFQSLLFLMFSFSIPL